MAKQILVVEDEAHIRQLVQINLKRAGYEVVTAANGREALEAVRARHPDLVVTDVMMPEVDGFEVLRTLKADDATSSIPVVMLTAKEQDADVMRGWQNGADLYLTKPFDVRELLVFVQRILGASDEDKASEKVYDLNADASVMDRD